MSMSEQSKLKHKVIMARFRAKFPKLTPAQKYELLTLEYMHSLFWFDAELGQVFWRERPRSVCISDKEWRRWNSRHANTRAGACWVNLSGILYWKTIIPLPNNAGHLTVSEGNVVWLFTHSEWPKNQLDHKNGDGRVNKIDNLRPAQTGQNNQNNRLYKNNTSGYPGVIRHGSGFWAYIAVKRKRIHEGPFKTFEEAVEARQRLKAKHHTFQPFDRGFNEPEAA